MFQGHARSLSLSIVLTLMGPICAGAPPVAQDKAIKIHGLEAIGMDAWTQFLVKGRETGLSISDSRGALENLLSLVKNEQQTFKQVRETLQKTRVASAADYYEMGQMLLELRQSLRQRTDLTQKALQDSMFLLQLMAEESLYVGSKKFSDFPKEITFSEKLSDSGKTRKLRQFNVQTGDVVLSKSTGFGSSSFIALTMDHPHIYSHSTPVYVDQSGEVLSPEAEIDDGVKLRNMKKDYVDNSKTRMYIYRYQGDDAKVPEKVVAGMENLVAEMYQRTGGDPVNKAAFIYDFSMTPGEAATRGLFCSSVSYEAYVRGGIQDAANPYHKSVWSPINKGREILLKALNMNTNRVPAPGDLELNKNFRLVGARIDITKLNQDRVEMAIIDTFLSEIESNKESMKRMASALESLSKKPIDKKGLMAMASAGLLPKELSDKAAMIQKIPDSINLKQMVFFAFLNELMTPKLREAMLAQISMMEAQGHIVGTMELRKMAKTFGASMQSEIAALESKIVAVTGVGSCGKALL